MAQRTVVPPEMTEESQFRMQDRGAVVATTLAKTESTDGWDRRFVGGGVVRSNRDRRAVHLGRKAAQCGKGLDWHPRSSFVERRQLGQFRYPLWLWALLLDHDARRIEIADLVDQPAIVNPYRGSQQSWAKRAVTGLPPRLALVDEVIDSVDEPLEHVESEEGVVAWLGTDG